MAGFALSVPAGLSLLAGVASFPLARWVWRFRGRPGAAHWTAVQLLIGVYGLSYGLALATFDPALHRLIDPVVWLARHYAAPFILLFALSYTGRDRLTGRAATAGLLGFWTVPLAIQLTNPAHHLWWRGYHIAPLFGSAAVDFTPQAGLYVFSILAWTTTGVAVLLVLEPVVSYRGLFGRQTAAVATVVAVPTAANVVWVLRLGPTAHLDLTPVGCLVSSAVLSYALFREDLFEFLPAATRVASDIAIDDVTAGVLTVAPNGRLVDYNTAAAPLVDGPDALGRPLETVLAPTVPLEEAEFTVEDPGGRNRTFEVDVSAIDSAAGRLVGYVVTFYDITDERRRQRRLAVQNRVLRHNLRNGMTVVEGNAERIGQVAAEDRVDGLVENIREKASELMAVGEKVRQFDAALADDPAPIDVEQVCRAVVADKRAAFPEADLAFEADGTGCVEGRERVLRQVLGEAVENGIVHDDGPGSITVRLSSGPGRVRITVVDDGPGIPSAELAALERGDEDKLAHGSSVGLWITDLGVDALGGTVAFDTDDGGGTTVSVDLPVRTQ